MTPPFVDYSGPTSQQLPSQAPLPTLKGSVLDRTGSRSDEIRIVLNDQALAALGPDYPRLVNGLVLTTADVTGAYTNAATFVSVDDATGGCPVTLQR